MEKAVAAASKKWGTGTWLMIALGGAAVVAGAAFVLQAKHAALGRQVHRNVTKFLIDHGSQVHNGMISGGLVSTPMKTNTAVNSTVVSMLNNYADMLMQQAPPAVPGVSDDQIVTGTGGVEGRSAQGGQPVRGDDQIPHPSPPKRGSASASFVRNPTDGIRDDGGFGQEKKDVQEYDPHEFVPKGPKPPENVDIFAGDGIPAGTGAVAVRQEGYQ